MQTNPPPLQLPPHASDDAEIINFPALKNWLSLFSRAARRRKRLVFGIAGVMVVLAAVISNVLPKTYRVSCRLLAQRNPVLMLQGDNTMEAAPTRAAAELMAKRETVLSLVEETKLLKEWKANRPFLFRTKDKILGMISKPPDDMQMTANLADYLATKIKVWNDETTVTIQVDWRDPILAYRLADAAQRGFLEMKHVQEVSTVAESVAILEGHLGSVRGQIDTAVAEMQALRERKKREETTKVAPAPTPSADASAERAPPAPAAPRPPPPPTEAQLQQERRVSELPVMIETKMRMINELDGNRMRRLADLQGKIAEQRATYTEQHPAVAEAQQAILAASVESPQVAKLRSELKQLQNEYEGLKRTTGLTPTRRGGGGGRGVGVEQGGGLGDVIRIEQESSEERDPEISYARSKLQFAITNYQQLQDQIHKARIDLDTAQAAFKYRYSMVNPPEIPKGPVSPKVPLIIAAALIAGLLIGVIVAASQELQAGIIFEPWQIEHATSLPVLAAVQIGDGGKSSGSPSS